MEWSRVPSPLLMIFFLTMCSSQGIGDCPLNWELYNMHCYHFVIYPPRSYKEAETACLMDGATLVSVNDDAEGQFIVNWLASFPINTKTAWYTSGVDRGGAHIWTGDGSDVPDGDFWVFELPTERDKEKLNLVYRYSVGKDGFAWDWERKDQALAYICEISQKEAFRINKPQRDYTYGIDTADRQNIINGPKFTDEPKSLILAGIASSAHIDCVATGNPQPTYRWYRDRGTPQETEITQNVNSRYTLTNGRLLFSKPDVQEDTGDYQCIAENTVGSIISDPITISSGFLNEFVNKQPGGVRAHLYHGTVINCNTPQFNPKVVYQWYKNDAFNFIRPTLNRHTFISENGKLYISEVQAADAGDYHCIVTLAAPFGQQLVTNQPPSKASLGIGLDIIGENAIDFGPTIHNDFPAVFPSPPERGQEVRIECLAYGRLPLTYSWEKKGGHMAARSHTVNLGRVLVIPNAELEDSGTYTCHVKRRGDASDTKSVYVSIVSKPYFQFPLTDKFVDQGSQLTWMCDAVGVPRVQYTWYKNTKLLASVAGDIEIYRNTLTIKTANAEKHNGMYQCAAENKYGKSLSSGVLKVLAFKPSFVKYPLSKTMMGTEGGNITIECTPEAAPTPELTWLQNGRDLGFAAGEGDSHRRFLNNGNLVISSLSAADAGDYTCKATNSKGTASSTGHLTILNRMVLTSTPTNTRVIVNNTAFLYCEASYDSAVTDLVYTWKFNGYPIDHASDPHFVKGVHENQRGLYIRNAQQKHEGTYTCVAETVQEILEAGAVLTVLGPPGEPYGVYAHQVTGNTVHLRWFPGDSHDDPVQAFMIEAYNKFDQEWDIVIREVPESSTQIDEYPSRRGTDIPDLGAATDYRFRVSARNLFGWSEPSSASKWFHIKSTVPTKSPERVGGGGGSRGVLTITWDPLTQKYHNGPGLKYKVYWREMSKSRGVWLHKTVDGTKHQYVSVVGRDNYYLSYEVKVQAINDLGSGPNSTVVTIYSAEELPVHSPPNLHVAEQNATAAIAYWDLIEDDREHVNGKIRGYQINWWVDDRSPGYIPKYKFVRHYGQTDQGWIIGLKDNTNYWCNIQVYNGAGLGRKSDDWWFSTYYSPPTHYPEFVNVSSHGPNSVYVTWRGVSTQQEEESVTGYKLLHWKAGDPMGTAESTQVGLTFSTVVSGIEKGIVYTLRMMGTSFGGDGKKSPPVYFTLGGQIRVDRSSTEIVASSFKISASVYVIILSTLASFQQIN